jgi:hypothetical protein
MWLEPMQQYAPPCVDTPHAEPSIVDKLRRSVPPNSLPIWLYKPNSGAGGAGIKLINDPVVAETGTASLFIHDCVLWHTKNREGKPVTLRGGEFRAYGVVTQLSPLQVFVSRRGAFRTSPSHTNYTLENVRRDISIAVNNDAMTTHGYEHGYNPDVSDYPAEEMFATTGSFRKFGRILSAAGLDERRVMESLDRAIVNSIVTLYAACNRTDSSDASSVRYNEEVCGRTAFFFNVDAVAMSDGRVYLYEMHTAPSLKVSMAHPSLTERTATNSVGALILAAAEPVLVGHPSLRSEVKHDYFKACAREDEPRVATWNAVWNLAQALGFRRAFPRARFAPDALSSRKTSVLPELVPLAMHTRRTQELWSQLVLDDDDDNDYLSNPPGTLWETSDLFESVVRFMAPGWLEVGRDSSRCIMNSSGWSCGGAAWQTPV